MIDADLLEARAAFVAVIKEENFYSDFTKQSLKQHWNGAASGFADRVVHSRWNDFLAGWQAAMAKVREWKEQDNAKS